MFLQPNVEDDKQIAATHFFDFQLRNACSTVIPTHWNHGIAIAAHNCLQGQFYSQVEVVAEDRLDALDYLATVKLKSISGVVVGDFENP